MNSKSRFTAIVRARISPEHTRALQGIADARELSVAAVLREAVRFYLFHYPPHTAASAKTEELIDA